MSHEPECAERRAEWRWSEDCICPALRACEQRVLTEARGRVAYLQEDSPFIRVDDALDSLRPPTPSP